MRLSSVPSGGSRRLTAIAAAIGLVALALLAVASRAHASETIYWDNFAASPATISFANIDGSGGGSLNLLKAGGSEDVKVVGPEGMAYDPANGRIYIANSDNEITWVSVDGSGAGVLDTGAAPVESPQGIAVDPQTQIVYWANSQISGSIGWADANGSGGGELNTTGATVESPERIGLDTTNGHVYWVNDDGEVSYANLDNTGGGRLHAPALGIAESVQGIDVDPAAGRLYFLEDTGAEEGYVSWLNLSGVGGGEIDISGPNFDAPYGMAFDPTSGRFYWANYGNGVDPTGAIGTATLVEGEVGGITPVTAPVNGPQDPVILKSPTGTGAPQVTGSATSPSTLSCSQGSWSADYPGSYVYGAPTSYVYSWSENGSTISGANGATLSASSPGTYSCSVSGTNISGSATQTSSAFTVAAPVAPPAPASLGTVLKSHKVRVKAGKVAVVKVALANRGGTASAAVKVCAKLTKKAKKGLKAPKCVSVSAVPAGKTVIAKLRVKTRGTAKGLYKFTVLVKGAAVKSMTAKVQVIAPKATKHKK